MDYSRPEKVLAIYDKAITDKVFRTPVGIYYLRDIQRYLKQQPQIREEQIQPIPLYFGYESRSREKTHPTKNRIQPTPPRKSSALPMSVFLNVVLVIAICAMFMITLNSSQPNILNYERALTDKYSYWEQELTQREQALREQERINNMENP